MVKDKTGKRYGMLTVLMRAPNAKDGSVMWLCKCDCGNAKEIRSSNLKENGTTKSCGCYKKEYVHKQKNRLKHGMSGTRIFRVWNGMKCRCHCKTNASYKNYGGRGIRVCDEWLNSFESFHKWSVNNGYHDDLTLDRINNDGNYEPDNCRWVTMKTQDNNKRNNKFLEHNGVERTISEWSEIVGSKDRHCVSDRLKRGWSIEEAVTTPVRRKRGD